MQKVRNSALFLLLSLVLIFVVQNWEPVSITFLFWSLELPRLVLVVLLLLTGFASGALVFSGRGNRSDEWNRFK